MIKLLYLQLAIKVVFCVSDLHSYLILSLYSDVGWAQGEVPGVMIGIIETIQNHHLVMEETTEIMIIKEI